MNVHEILDRIETLEALIAFYDHTIQYLLPKHLQNGHCTCNTSICALESAVDTRKKYHIELEKLQISIDNRHK